MDVTLALSHYCNPGEQVAQLLYHAILKEEDTFLHPGENFLFKEVEFSVIPVTCSEFRK